MRHKPSKPYTIAVYCSAKDAINEQYLAMGDALGKWIAEEGHTLVYGGAKGGLMSRVSNSVKKHGGKVIGVIPERIIAAHRLAENCDKLYVVSSMGERKQKMRELATCFVCLPGSYGTLDEMMDVVSAGIIGEHRKPLYVVNQDGFYNHLRLLADHMRELNFLPQQESYKPIFVDSLEELFTTL